MSNTGKCRLCLSEGQLRRSHIFPELLWKPVYRAKDHSVQTIHAELPYVRRLRKGIRDRLLCADCESKIGRWEAVFAECWMRVLPEQIPAGWNAILRQGLPYREFKLFHLSLLWRASVSTLEEFGDVRLGPHENRIRQMLVEEEPGADTEYRIFPTGILQVGTRRLVQSILGVPAPQKQFGHWIYSSLYAGCVWHIIVSGHNPLPVDDYRLKEDGTILFPLEDIREFKGAIDLMARGQRLLQRSGRTRNGAASSE